MEAISGIYRFFNKTTGRSYVGSSGDIKARINRHLYLLNKGSHWNTDFLRAWQEFSQDDFVISSLEEVSIDNLLDRENFWMKECRPLFNIVKVAQKGRRGIPHSEDSKRIEVVNMRKYCRDNNISSKAMYKLLAGKTEIMIPLRLRKEKRGWTLPKNVDNSHVSTNSVSIEDETV